MAFFISLSRPANMPPTHPLAEPFSDLEKKIVQLVIDHEQLKLELRDVRKENDALKATIKKQTDDMKRLHQKRDNAGKHFLNPREMSKIVSLTNADPKETAELKAIIDECIQELNKCIAYLSR